MLSDKKNTIDDLRQICQKFRLERNWKEAEAATFAKDIAVEAGELLDHFVWDEKAYLENKEIEQEVHYELVDVLFAVLIMSQVLKIDLSATLEKKIKILALKYPAAECRSKKQISQKACIKWHQKRRKLFRRQKNV